MKNEREIILDDSKEIISTTNKKGIILDSNSYFNEISGYDDNELIGANHNIIRHPDMPKAVFKIMWEHLLKDKKNFIGVVKNKAKDNSFYWVITDFTFEDVDGETIYTATRRNPNRNLVKRIEFIYKRMIEIEKEHKKDEPMKHSLKFLNDIIYSSGYDDYDSFIEFLTK